jgi:hypothetical protein
VGNKGALQFGQQRSLAAWATKEPCSVDNKGALHQLLGKLNLSEGIKQ